MHVSASSLCKHEHVGATAGDSILAIITLAAPHQQAPANVHAPLHAFYHKLQQAARSGGSQSAAVTNSKNSSTDPVPLLSIAGGEHSHLALANI